MFDRALVAVNELAAEIAVDFMEVETVLAGDEAHGIENVGAEFVDIACFAGIVAVDLDAAGQRAALVFKTGYIISLPAVHAEVEVLHLLQHLVSVDTKFCVTLFGYFISLFYSSFVHDKIDLYVFR